MKRLDVGGSQFKSRPPREDAPYRDSRRLRFLRPGQREDEQVLTESSGTGRGSRLGLKRDSLEPRLAIFRTFIAAAVLAATVAVAGATECIHYDDYIHARGSLALAAANGVFIDSGKAYIADGDAGLRVVDLSDPDDPRVIGTMDTPGSALSVVVRSGIAYVADDRSGLEMIDVADPAHMAILGTYGSTGSVRGVAVEGDYAYAAESAFGLRVIDITDPAHPTLVATADTPGYAYDVVVRSPYAYVADDAAGLSIVRIGNPLTPELVTSVDTPGSARKPTIVGSRVYVADGATGIRVVNVSIPSQAWLETGLSFPLASCRGVCTSGTIVYAAIDGNEGSVGSGILAIDATDGGSPVVIGSVFTGIGPMKAVASDGSIACLAEAEDGIVLIDVSNPSYPPLLGSLVMTGYTNDVTIVGSIAYVCEQDLALVDVSDPTSPTILGHAPTWDYLSGVSVDGDLACAGSSMGLEFYDVRDPNSPTRLGGIRTSWVHRVALFGGFAYAAADSGMEIIDATVPTAPVKVARFGTSRMTAVAVSGRYAYLSAWADGTRILDVSDPSAPVVVSVIDGLSAGELVVRDNILYVAAGRSRGLVCFDVTDPSTPLRLGRATLPDGPDQLGLSGNYAYTTGLYCLYVVDIHDPAAPFMQGTFDLPEWLRGVDAGSDFAIVADDRYGIKILHEECEPTADVAGGLPSARGPVHLDPAWPNPFAGTTSIRCSLGPGERGSIAILTPSGRVVRRIAVAGGRAQSGGVSDALAVWDGTDDAGRRLARGVYFCRLDSRPGVASQKVILLK